MLNKYLSGGVFFSFFLLSLGQFALITRGVGGGIYAFDLFVGFFSLAALIFLFISKKSFKIPSSYHLFYLFTFIALLSLVFNLENLFGTRLYTSAFYFVRWTTYLLFATVVFNLINQKVLELPKLLNQLFVIGLLISIAGVIQLAVLPDFTVLDPSLGWDPHKNRIASTFFDPNFFGGYLGIILALFLSKSFAKKNNLTYIHWLALFTFPLVVLFLTFSRSAWAMFAVIVFVFGVFKSPKLLFLALILAFSAYFAIPRVQTRLSGITDPADSASFRLISWQNTLEIANDNLLYGVGFNSFRFAQKDYGFINPGTLGGNSGAGSDSSMLLVLATTGVMGFVVFVSGYFYSLIRAVLSKNTYSVLIVAVLSGLFIQSQFINALFYPQILSLWLVIIGLQDLAIDKK